jgi:hypothetical protein
MNIPDLLKEVKTFGEKLQRKETYTILLIMLVGFGSFGLGRLSTLQEAQSPILLENSFSESFAAATVFPAGTEASATPIEKGGRLVASKSGAKYHFPWCSGAQRISEANKVWFDSVEEARKAGYTPASNCKGLR